MIPPAGDDAAALHFRKTHTQIGKYEFVAAIPIDIDPIEVIIIKIREHGSRCLPVDDHSRMIPESVLNHPEDFIHVVLIPGDSSTVHSMWVFTVEFPRVDQMQLPGRHLPQDKRTEIALPDACFGNTLPAPPRLLAAASRARRESLRWFARRSLLMILMKNSPGGANDALRPTPGGWTGKAIHESLRVTTIQPNPFGSENTTPSCFPSASSIRRPPHSPRRESTL